MDARPLSPLPDYDPMESRRTRAQNETNADTVFQQVQDMLVIPKQSDEDPTPTPTPTPVDEDYPFDVTFSAGSDAAHSTVTIRPGTLSGLIPTNIATTYDLPNVGTYYLVISAVAADAEIASCSLSVPSVAPGGIGTLLGQPPLSFDYLLGIIADAVWYRTIGTGSLFAAPIEAFRIDKAAPAPGTLPYEVYYTWDIQAA